MILGGSIDRFVWVVVDFRRSWQCGGHRTDGSRTRHRGCGSTANTATEAAITVRDRSGRPRTEPETAVRAVHANYSLRTGANQNQSIFLLNQKRHEPEPDLSLNPFLTLDPDKGFSNQISLARFWLVLGPEAVEIRCKLLVSSLGLYF